MNATIRLSPRQRRVLTALLVAPLSTAEVRRVAGCSNAGDLVFKLRRKGFHLPATESTATDRDGLRIEFATYRADDTDRELIRAALTTGQEGGAA